MSSTGLAVGSTYTGNARTITDAEIAFLPALMGANSPLFHDEETAKTTPAGRRMLFGPALLGIAIAGTEPVLHGAVIALMGIDGLRFRSGVGVGDTVTPSLTVDERIEKPDRAGDLLLITDVVHNQAGTVVLDFRRTVMVRRDALR